MVQNKAARAVARLGIFTPTKALMKACGLMSVRQLLVYHSLVILQKTISSKTSVYLYKKVTSGGDFAHRTRQAATCPPGFSFSVTHPTDSGSIRQGPGPTLDLSMQGWCWKSVDCYNTLPTELKLERNLFGFKKRLKDWIGMNISI